MTTIFNGRDFAARKESELKNKVVDLRKKGVTPKLVSILVGEDTGSLLYTSLKKKAAERIGAKLEIRKFPTVKSVNQLIQLIKKLNKDKKVHGIMIQLPFPRNFNWDEREKIIDSILPSKDVDGMREDSKFEAPATKAISSALDVAKTYLPKNPKVVVVGAKGFVGRKTMKILNRLGYKPEGVDIETKDLREITQKADVLISTTGVAGLIKADMIKNGAVIIDIGSPKGDVEPSVANKASFITPVPGGIGPVTISSLLENLVEAAYNSVTHTQGKGS